MKNQSTRRAALALAAAATLPMSAAVVGVGTASAEPTTQTPAIELLLNPTDFGQEWRTYTTPSYDYQPDPDDIPVVSPAECAPILDFWGASPAGTFSASNGTVGVGEMIFDIEFDVESLFGTYLSPACATVTESEPDGDVDTTSSSYTILPAPPTVANTTLYAFAFAANEHEVDRDDDGEVEVDDYSYAGALLFGVVEGRTVVTFMEVEPGQPLDEPLFMEFSSKAFDKVSADAA